MIKQNLEKISETVDKYAKMAERDPKSVTILGATKSVPVEKIVEAANLGIKVFGENRVQEAMKKIPQIQVAGLEWHMIGHLQRNKAKHAIRLFSVIQSLDSIKLAKELEKRLLGKTIKVMIEVNTSGESSKYGLKPDSDGILRFTETLLGFKSIEIVGLMTLGPYPPQETHSRKAFALLRELRDYISERLGLNLPVLSMGMSEDYHWAILEGATMIRLGRALFGPRED